MKAVSVYVFRKKLMDKMARYKVIKTAVLNTNGHIAKERILFKAKKNTTV